MIGKLVLSVLILGIGAAKDDASSVTAEKDWFHASHHLDDLRAYCRNSHHAPCLDCLEMFSNSWKVASTWKRHGYKAHAFDILNSPSEDVLSKEGFYSAVDLVLMFLSRILVVFCLKDGTLCSL